MSSYSQSELILLKYTDGFNAKDSFPNYFSTVHKLNATSTVQKFRNDGLITIAPISYSLGKCTVPELKAFLAEKGIKPKGSKAVIIQYIIDTFDVSELECYFPERYYIITETGQKMLDDNLATEDYSDRFEPILKGFSDAYGYVKARQYDKAAQCLKSNGHSCVGNHSDNKVYDDFFSYSLVPPTEMDEHGYKAYIILYHLYGVRTESAVKDFKKRTGIEIPFATIHKHLRIVRAIDDLIVARNLSSSIKHSPVRYKYSIKSCKDESVCSYCKNLSGKLFDVSEAVIGVNFPPLNGCKSEYCRCFASFDLV